MPNGKIYWYVETLTPDHRQFSIVQEEVQKLLSEPEVGLNNFGTALEKVVKEQKAQLKEVSVYNKVKYRFLDEKDEREIELVGPGQTDQLLGRIGIDKPLGATLVGQEVGAIVEMNGRQIEILGATKLKMDDEPEEQVEPPKITNIKELDLGEKREAILLPPNQMSLVLAGPGCGKSFALVNRAAFMLEDHQFNPNTVLILSFSREAVAEVKRRLTKFGVRNIEFLLPFTIDSFAASLLVKKSPNYPWGDGNYDDAIIEATKVLDRSDLTWINHVFVDEVQDIVGCRADFVTKILSLLPDRAGATLLGDRNQSIYNWSLMDQISKVTSDQFVKSISALKGNIRKFTFEKNWRTTDSIRDRLHAPVLALLSEVESSDPTKLDSLKEKWRDLLKTYPKVGTSGPDKYKSGSELGPREGVQKCILTKDNGQLIGEKENNIPRQLAVRVLGKYSRGLLPAWVAKLFFDFRLYRIISRTEEFEPFWGRLEHHDGWTLEEGWNLLKEIELSGAHPKSVDLSMLKRRLVVLKEVPVSNLERSELHSAPLVISTIHCSKGLEFDEVMIVEPWIDGIKSLQQLIDELRVFYVGISRAKSQVRLLPDTTIAWMRSLRDEHSGAILRWYKESQGRTIFSIDNEDDVDGGSFVTKYGKSDTDKVQYMLQQHIKPGDEVIIRLEGATDYYDGQRYFIYWGDLCLGCMSYNFYRSMEMLFSPNKPLEFKSTVGRLYTEFKYNVHSGESVDTNFTNTIEAWTAIKLTGLARG